MPMLAHLQIGRLLHPTGLPLHLHLSLCATYFRLLSRYYLHCFLAYLHARRLACHYSGFLGWHDKVGAGSRHDLRLVHLIMRNFDRSAAEPDPFAPSRALGVPRHLEAVRHGRTALVQLLEHARGQILLTRLLLLILLIY